MVKILFMLVFIAIGLYGAKRLNEKNQKKITLIVGVLFGVLALFVVISELMI